MKTCFVHRIIINEYHYVRGFIGGRCLLTSQYDQGRRLLEGGGNWRAAFIGVNTVYNIYV